MKSACPFRPREDRSGKGRAVAIALFSIMALLAPGRAAALSLSPAGVARKAAILTNPNVEGVSISQDWGDLETAEDVYDWSFLDSEVARVAAAGRSVLLRINS